MTYRTIYKGNSNGIFGALFSALEALFITILSCGGSIHPIKDRLNTADLIRSYEYLQKDEQEFGDLKSEEYELSSWIRIINQTNLIYSRGEK